MKTNVLDLIQDIQHWLVARVAASIGLPADDIDISLPFSYYGLDSVAAVGLSGELEDWLGRKLPPTLTWDYPSIALLSAHLAQR
jgi:acyl carrier protein